MKARDVYLGVLLVLTAASAGRTPAAEFSSLHLDAGPILLHANMDQQWGGHTFAYLLEGERAIFWSATMYNPDGKTWGSLIGQFPKPGIDAPPATTEIPVSDPDVKSMTQPLLLRSPDGYIHVILGVSHDTGDPGYAPGEVRYYRSAAPDDISQLVDRTECIPRIAPYNQFHLRMNAGISREGARAAIVVLAISSDGSVPFNTPVIFQGERQGADFVFRDPVKYAEPMGLFYPQIALTDDGTVITGQVWDNPDRSIARLIQLDAEANIVHREDLPADEDGNYWCLDLRPVRAEDWGELLLYYNKYPKRREDCRHEFWTYTPATHRLEQRRSIPVPESQINYGKWIPVSETRSVFLHNPSMGAFEAYDGDLLGEGAYEVVPLPATNPVLRGHVGSAYTFVPNPLQGGVSTPAAAWFATDYIPQKSHPDERIRGALVLYRIAFDAMVEAATPAEVAPVDGVALQRAIDAQAARGGTLRLAPDTTVTCTVRQDEIAGETSTHALLVRPNVDLDLNGGTLLLDLRSNSYGVRLAEGAAIRNGVIRIVHSENKGFQAIWHSVVSVGAAYGDGGTVEKPGYFSRVGHWRIESLTIDQPFEAAAIQLMSEAHDGLIRNIRILDSDKALLGIGLDWGSVGPITTADAEVPRMRELWTQGQIYSTHPHDIVIEDIEVGRLARNVDGNDAGVRCSACHHITIRDVRVAFAATAVAIFGGDFGYEFAPEAYRSMAHSRYLIEDVSIERAGIYGIVLNGTADNIYRSTLKYGYTPLLDPVHPGLQQPIVRLAHLLGVNGPSSRGIYLTAAQGATFEDVEVSGFETGVAVNDWVNAARFLSGSVSGNQENTRVRGATEPPTDTVFADGVVR
jgi:hypothetical protein